MFDVDITYQSLSEYLNEIRELIQEATDYQWVVAEIAKIDADKNGHYWIDLVEKKDDQIIAQCGAVLWRSNVETIQNFFLKTGIELQKGIKILFLAKATFHEKYGFKLSIIRIDPSFTLGEMALKRKEVIERLTREGLIDKNKLIELPLVIQKIAIVSSESAAGYEDFLKILKENKHGFKFYIKLFDAYVQGESAVNSLINALERCMLEIKNFDVVVMIRGGGSVVDLQCFNDYELARNIALMPIPVLTGIGHTRDETVADYVAWQSFKTPSELAKFIVDKAFSYDSKIDYFGKMILHRSESIIKMEISKNQSIKERFRTSTQNCIERLNGKINLKLNEIYNSVLKKLHSQQENIYSLRHELNKSINRCFKIQEVNLNNINNKIRIKVVEHVNNGNFKLQSYIKNLKVSIKNILMIKDMKIDRIREKLYLLSPENILKRGYSITYLNGKVLKSSEDVSVGYEVQIQLYKGKIAGKVITKEEDIGESKLF